jgi:hypothetical protein
MKVEEWSYEPVTIRIWTHCVEMLTQDSRILQYGNNRNYTKPQITNNASLLEHHPELVHVGLSWRNAVVIQRGIGHCLFEQRKSQTFIDFLALSLLIVHKSWDVSKDVLLTCEYPCPLHDGLRGSQLCSGLVSSRCPHLHKHPKLIIELKGFQCFNCWESTTTG